MVSTSEVVRVILVGAGATAVMGVWSVIVKSLGISTLD